MQCGDYSDVGGCEVCGVRDVRCEGVVLHKSFFSHNGKSSWRDLGIKQTEALCMLNQTLKQTNKQTKTNQINNIHCSIKYCIIFSIILQVANIILGIHNTYILWPVGYCK